MAVTNALVIGAGAIGGLLAARLSLAGYTVAVVARGAHLDAIRRRGAVLLQNEAGLREAPVSAFASPSMAPDAHAVFVTLKAHQLPALADEIAAKARSARAFVPIQNGIPWWYFQRTEGPYAGRVVKAVDPEGRLAELLSSARLVPAVARVAAEVIAPGHVFHREFDVDAFPIGALDAQDDEAAAFAAGLIQAAGFQAPRSDVRQWVWIKLLGNVWTNPIGALARATVSQTATHPASRQLALALMGETERVARAFGIEPGVDFAQRLDRAIRLRQGTKSSMLQDVERGREPEHRAILGALLELADLAGIDVPHVRAMNACMELLAEIGVAGARTT